MAEAKPSVGSQQPQSTVGVPSIGEFREGSGCWNDYIERFEFFCSAQGIVDDVRKRALLLSGVGSDAYSRIKTIIAPIQPSSMGYDAIVAAVNQYLEPKPSVIVSRFNFHKKMQAQGQTVKEFVAELKKMAVPCEFGSALDGMLRDRFVCGANDDSLQKKLLAAEDTLTFEQAVKAGVAAETAALSARQLAPDEPDTGHGVNRVGVSRPTGAEATTRYERRECHRCGGNHSPQSCRFKTYRCHSCGVLGHLSRKCRTPSRGGRAHGGSSAHWVAESGDPDNNSADLSDPNDVCNIHSVGKSRTPPITAEVLVYGVPVTFEVDTGAASTLMNAETFQTVRATGGDDSLELQPSSAKLRTYTGEPIPIEGEFNAVVHYGKQHLDLPVIVVSTAGPNLLGRDWLNVLKLDWHNIKQVREMPGGEAPFAEKLKQKYSDVFANELGCMKDVKVTFDVDPTVKPRFYRPRNLPYAYRKKVEAQLDAEVAAGVLEPVRTSDWACQIVPVLKSDGNIRLCGNYKQTANLAIKVDKHPLPKSKDLFSQLAGGKVFAKIDLSRAYQQLRVAEEHRHLLTINTHRGLFRPTRLSFGVNSSPGIFQREMEKLLAGIDNCFIFLDDVLLSGRDEDELVGRLEQVFQRFKEGGLKVRPDKCQFLVHQVEYLGHVIDKDGIRTSESKVRAITQAAPPKGVSELKSFLGIFNYYSRFMPNRAQTLQPLYELLRKDRKWEWGREQQKAFEECKQLLISNSVLVHFDQALPLVLTCDASSRGIGAVISHRFPNGTEKPIGYASRTLQPAEVKYSQIEREALGIIFGVTVFRDFLYGTLFELVTDHKPLITLFGENKGMPEMTSSRLKRWALKLSEYSYTIRYKSTRDIPHADGLSRLPVPGAKLTVTEEEGDVLLINNLEELGIMNADKIGSLTNTDPVLSQVTTCIQMGWPEGCNDTLKPFAGKQTELYMIKNVVMWGTRVVVPSAARKHILAELHSCHFGVVKMKALARTTVWWPGIDKDIEVLAASCALCRTNSPNPPKDDLHPWQRPPRAWSRLHIDFATSKKGKNFLVVCDAYSKWIEVECMTSIDAPATVRKLIGIFSRFGLPDTIVSDNAPTFTSSEFQQFLKRNSIEHKTIAPYVPFSNGLAERAVKELKTRLEKMCDLPMEEAIAKWLFFYRATPHATTGETPGKLLIGYRPVTRFDRLKPSIQGKVTQNQQKQVENRKRRNVKSRACLQVGQKVWARRFSRGREVEWCPAVVLTCLHPLYTVKMSNGQVHKRHINQLYTQRAAEPNVDNGGRPVGPSVERVRHRQLVSDADYGDSTGASNTQPGPLASVVGSPERRLATRGGTTSSPAELPAAELPAAEGPSVADSGDGEESAGGVLHRDTQQDSEVLQPSEEDAGRDTRLTSAERRFPVRDRRPVERWNPGDG